METYQNLAGDSGVSAYEASAEQIKVQFDSGKTYTYSYRKAGRVHVERMKALAGEGRGLNSYIKKNTNFLYD